MNRDIVSIIVRLLKRYQIDKLNKQYHKEYYSHTNDVIKNTRYAFMFNYRWNIKNRHTMIYNMVKRSYPREVCQLPKNYF